MNNRLDARHQGHSAVILLLIVSALLPLFFNSPGVIAGFILAIMVLGWLILAKDHQVKNRIVLLIVAALVLLMNGAFLIGVLTDGTWQF